MRIGTNHGSLSDRIMNRYGDTPEGMVESALEFVRICEAHGYRELILSMKASNPVVVLQVYRLLAERMAERGHGLPVPPRASPRRATARTAGSSRRSASARCSRTGSATRSASR